MGLTKTTLERIKAINILLNQFGPMTLRQIYYQLAPLGLNYRMVQYACQKGRENGLIDIDAIVDRSRPSYGTYKFSSLSELLFHNTNNFQLDYWETEKYKVEIWSEKDALSAILAEEAQKYRVPVRVTRGFLSTSNKHTWSDKDTVILYFGDFDPSGLWIDLDLKNNTFLKYFHFKRMALTAEQVQQQQLPHVMVKKQDPRAAEYIKEYGKKCWELDALPPDRLRELVRESIEPLLTFDLEQKRTIELEIRGTLEDLAKKRLQDEENARREHER
jgi:hypothetical protein